jgi:pilus assembly protein CpaB
VSIRTIFVAFLALVSGSSAVIGINTLRNQNAAPPRSDTVPLVVVGVDIPRGRTITADLLTTKEYPKDLVPEGSITSKEEALNRTVAIAFVKGEPLLEAKLASRSAGRGLAALIPDDMRACTITTTLSSAVAGLLLPGNHVDVLLTISTGQNDGTGGGSTTTLLQNVEILAIDQHIEAPADNKSDPNMRSVTLLVTPDQGAKLELGQTKGTIHLLLRNPGDNKAARTQPATLAGIQFHQEIPWDQQLKALLQAVARMAAPAPKPYRQSPSSTITVRTVRGVSEGKVRLGAEDAP